MMRLSKYSPIPWIGKNIILAGLTLMVIAIMATIGSVSAWVEEDYDYDSGTVNGIDWNGTAHVGWDGDSGSGGIDYGGEGLTEADSTIDELYVSTRGSEYCGHIKFDVDWHNDNHVFDTWLVGESGDGWAWVAQCSWFLNSQNVIVRNDVEHQVWDGGGPTDTGSTRAEIETNIIQE